MAEKTWEELTADIVSMRSTMGFNPVTMDNAGSKTMCLVAELFEVEQALHGSGDVAEELADVAMYALAMIHDLGGGVLTLRTARQGANPYQPPECFTALARKYAVEAFECWRRGKAKDVVISAEIVHLHVARMALGLRVDLKAEVGKKISKNLATRDYRHGGKHPDS